jgi:hypothetical protein
MPARNTRLKHVCIVEPIPSNYSLPIFLELAQHGRVNILFSLAPSDSGFGEIALPDGPNVRCFPVSTLKPLGDRLGMFKRGVLPHIIREKPDALLLSANMRELSFWAAVVCARMLGIAAYARGSGTPSGLEH